MRYMILKSMLVLAAACCTLDSRAAVIVIDDFSVGSSQTPQFPPALSQDSFLSGLDLNHTIGGSRELFVTSNSGDVVNSTKLSVFGMPPALFQVTSSTASITGFGSLIYDGATSAPGGPDGLPRVFNLGLNLLGNDYFVLQGLKVVGGSLDSITVTLYGSGLSNPSVASTLAPIPVGTYNNYQFALSSFSNPQNLSNIGAIVVKFAATPSIGQTISATVQDIVVTPEPSSIAIWSLFGLVGMCVAGFKRRFQFA